MGWVWLWAAADGGSGEVGGGWVQGKGASEKGYWNAVE